MPIAKTAINLRMPPELKELIATAAQNAGVSSEAYIREAILTKLGDAVTPTLRCKLSRHASRKYDDSAAAKRANEHARYHTNKALLDAYRATQEPTT